LLLINAFCYHYASKRIYKAKGNFPIMPNVLVRDVETSVLEKLKIRAAQSGRSLQREMQIILMDAASFAPLSDVQVARKIKDSLRGRPHSDSADLLREDRNR
jgi:plasmid stability protein